MNSKTHILLLDVDGVLVTPPAPFCSKFKHTHGEAVQEFFSTAFQKAIIGQADLLDILPPFLAKLGYQ